VGYLLLVGAYRDNEVSFSHPLMRTLDVIRKAGANMQEIMLAPLGLDDVGRLVADSLHCEQDAAPAFGRNWCTRRLEAIHSSQSSFLTALDEEGAACVRLRRQRAWSWDLVRIRAKGYTDNVVDLIARKAGPFAPHDAGGLRATRLSGERRRDRHSGPGSRGIGGADRSGSLGGPFARKLVLPAGIVSTHSSMTECKRRPYALIPESERAAVHLRIGRLFVSRTAPEEMEEKIFEIVNQLNRGYRVDSIRWRSESGSPNSISLLVGRAKTSTALCLGANVLCRRPRACWQRRVGSSGTRSPSHWSSSAASASFLTGDFAAAERTAIEASRARAEGFG